MRRALEASSVLAGLILIAAAAGGEALGWPAVIGAALGGLAAAWRLNLLDRDTGGWRAAPLLWLQDLRRSPAALAGALAVAGASLFGRPVPVRVRLRRAAGANLAAAAFAGAVGQDPRLLATATDAEGVWLQAMDAEAVNMPRLRALEAAAARIHP